MAGHMNNLGLSYMRRFELAKDLNDVDKAITAHIASVNLTTDGHAKKSDHLNSLGISFMHRFEHTRELADIDKAISAHTDAVELSPEGHSHLRGYQTNLGSSFLSRFECTGELVDIDKAIGAHNDAVRLTADDHALKAACLNNLGNSYLRRFEHTRNLVDIDKAISSYKDAARMIPEDHAHKAAFLNNLGSSSCSRFALTGDRADVEMAVSNYRFCAKSSAAPPSLRFHAATRWARLSSTESSSLDGYGAALNLLPRVAWLGATIPDRHKQLVSISGIGNEAAAAAIEWGHHETALEWLEQGRSIVWAQLLNLRTPFDELRNADFELANDLEQVSKDLESAGIRDIPSDKELPAEHAARQHRKLALRWDALVERARSIPGFEDFLRPKKWTTLSRAARSGPVVVINVHKFRCDALIVIADMDEVIHIPLNDFSYDLAQKLQHSLNQLLSTTGVRMRDVARGPRMASTKHDNFGFEEILSVLWTNAVHPILGALAFSVSSKILNWNLWLNIGTYVRYPMTLTRIHLVFGGAGQVPLPFFPSTRLGYTTPMKLDSKCRTLSSPLILPL
jgi:tetratricopeptide (TPR) repeat protein